MAIFKNKKGSGAIFGVRSFECVFLLINLVSVLLVNPFLLSLEMWYEKTKLLHKVLWKINVYCNLEDGSLEGI